MSQKQNQVKKKQQCKQNYGMWQKYTCKENHNLKFFNIKKEQILQIQHPTK